MIRGLVVRLWQVCGELDLYWGIGRSALRVEDIGYCGDGTVSLLMHPQCLKIVVAKRASSTLESSFGNRGIRYCLGFPL
jgi:hypothetical protein